MPRRLTRRQVMLLLAALALLAGLAWLLRDFVSVMILKPLIDLGWLAWIGAMSLHQGLAWGIFLLAALIILLRGLFASPPRKRGARPAAAGAPPRDEDDFEAVISPLRGVPLPRYEQPSRYQFWKNSLAALPHSPFARERVTRDLQMLAAQVLADQQRTSPDEIKARVARGELELDPPVAALFRSQRGLVGIDDRRWWEKLFGLRPPPPLPSLDTAALVAWLEEQTGAEV